MDIVHCAVHHPLSFGFGSRAERRLPFLICRPRIIFPGQGVRWQAIHGGALLPAH
jgi:hypothetical protein